MIVMIAQSRVQSAYHRYKAIANEQGLTGYDTARKILDVNGLSQIDVEVSNGGSLSDHYDPVHRVINLSPDIYYKSSIAAISVAAHEVGHAIQHKEHYGAIALRNRLLPAAQIASQIGWVVLFAGLFLFASTPIILYIGIAMICIILAFQIITLPVELNASSRAIQQLNANHLVQQEEIPYVKAMLKAAAFTYIAAVLSTITQILRILLIAMSRNRRND